MTESTDPTDIDVRRPASRGRRAVPHLVAGIVYLALAILLTWPVATTLDTHLLGYAGDNMGAVHTLQWVWSEVSAFRIPWSTDLYGVPVDWVYFHPSILMEAVSVPLTGLFGPVAAFNLLTILSYAATGYCMFLLVRHLLPSTTIALGAGALFTATGPHQFDLLFNTNAVWGLPLLALALLRWREDPGRWWEVAIAGSVVALCNFYFIVYYVPVIMACLVPWRRLGDRRVLRGGLLATGLIIAVAAVAYIPPIVAVGDSTRNELESVAGRADSRPPTELLSLVIGSPNHPQLGDLYGRMGGHLDPTQAPNTGSGYLGIVILILAALGWRRARHFGAWLTLAVVGGIMMLGPTLLVNGHRLMPLPYRFLEYIPVLNYLRAPSRFFYVVSLALVVLAAFGLQRLVSSRALSARPRRVAVVTAICALGVWEMLFQLPRPTADARVPSVYAKLATLPGDPIIIEAPGGGFNDYQWLSYQRDSGLRIVNNAAPRPSMDDPLLLYRNPFLINTVAGPDSSALADDDAAFAASGRPDARRVAGVEELRRAGVGYALLHRHTIFGWANMSDPGFVSYRRYLRRYLGDPVYEDGDVELYALPGAPGRDTVARWTPNGHAGAHGG